MPQLIMASSRSAAELAIRDLCSTGVLARHVVNPSGRSFVVIYCATSDRDHVLELIKRSDPGSRPVTAWQ